jgi:murein DD-endopeptidase MepM/ murein hydrolase activator NlpD
VGEAPADLAPMREVAGAFSIHSNLTEIFMGQPTIELPKVPDHWRDDAQGSPLTTWPVPGHTRLNGRDPRRGQGVGAFGSTRDHGQGSHTGIDITAPVGTPVVAAGDGTVANIQPNPSKTYGNQVVIRHAHGFYTQYGHLSRTDITPGTTVRAGDVIGHSGKSGNVPRGADAHLHFEVRHGSMQPHAAGGHVVDPRHYLPAK